MRMSIDAQSCASVPPAPALISSCASRKSSGPESSERRRNASIASPSSLASRSTSADSSSSGSSASISSSSRAFSTRPEIVSKGSTQFFAVFTCWTTACAADCSLQKPGSAIRSSSCRSVSRLPSRSKIPPQLGESLGVLPELSRALALCHCSLLYDTSRPAHAADGSSVIHPCLLQDSGTRQRRIPRATRSEALLTAGEDLVERLLEMRGRVGELLPDLLDVFLVALLDLFTEELTQCSGSESLLATLRVVRHEIGYERA